MKVFISVDIEGATGVVSFSQCGRPDAEHFDYAFARRMLTLDVNAAIRGFRRAGATEVVVKDSHATCKNLLIDQLDAGTQLISGFGAGNDGMMDGIDSSFGACALIGYHGMAGAEKALMDHALVGGLYRFWINGTEAGEIAVSAAVAGAYGVPTLLVTSDDVGCKEALDCLPGVRTFSTKVGFGRYMGQLAHPETTGPAIEAAAHEALKNAESCRPYSIGGAVTMRAEFRNVEEADLAAQLENVNRLSGYTVEWTRPSFMTAHRAALSVFNMSIQGRRSGT